MTDKSTLDWKMIVVETDDKNTVNIHYELVSKPEPPSNKNLLMKLTFQTDEFKNRDLLVKEVCYRFNDFTKLYNIIEIQNEILDRIEEKQKNAAIDFIATVPSGGVN
jgi:hypothetical protein